MADIGHNKSNVGVVNLTPDKIADSGIYGYDDVQKRPLKAKRSATVKRQTEKLSIDYKGAS